MACSTNQMIVTRGGYGGGPSHGGNGSSFGGGDDGWDSGWPPGTMEYGAALDSSFSSSMGSFFSGVADGIIATTKVIANIAIGYISPINLDIPVIPGTGSGPNVPQEPKIY